MIQHAHILDPIDEYLQRPSAQQWQQWTKVKANFNDVLVRVVDVEERLKAERSAFVLEPEFPQLMETIHARAGLLRKLKKIDPPLSEPELRELRDVRDKYARLVAELVRTRNALDVYLARTRN